MIKMNEEEIREELNKVYTGESWDVLLDYITKLQNNWNELKKWCKENQYDDNFDSYQVDTYTTYGVILKKMQELEGNNE